MHQCIQGYPVVAINSELLLCPQGKGLIQDRLCKVWKIGSEAEFAFVQQQ